MLASSIPVKFALPFANAGTKNVIPVTASTTPGLASLTTGFPPITFTPLSAGGIPPAGGDFNGALFMTSSWDQWFSMGGPVSYDSAFSTAIGGYPKGAMISSATLGNFWISTADNNATNPDTGGAGWQKLFAGSLEVSVASAVAAAASGSAYVATSTLTISIPLSTGLNTSFSASVFAVGGIVTLTPNAADKINGGTAGASVTVAQGQFAFISTDAAGNIYVATALTATGGTITGNLTVQGTLTAVTPAFNDVTTKVATMAAVKAAGLVYPGGGTGITTATTLTASILDSWCQITAGVVVTLPPIANATFGNTITLINAAAGITIKGNGSEQIYFQGGGNGNTYSPVYGETLVLVSNGAGTGWFVVLSGAAGSLFGNSLALNGYQRIPGGLIIQQGVGTIAPGGSTVNYPLTFPTASFGPVLTASTTGTTDYFKVTGTARTGFTAASTVQTLATNYLVTGY